MMDIYPITVIRSRYRGTYEGAEWVAFNEHAQSITDAEADDVTCGSFFSCYSKPIGRGQTPTEAVTNLVNELQ